MIVRFLQATDYTPTASDNERCWGQLRRRTTRTEKPSIDAAGNSFVQRCDGPMVLYFPKGATPDLPDAVAATFIESGAAECHAIDVRPMDDSELSAAGVK